MILSVLICEDDRKQRERMETIVSDYIAAKDYDMEIVLSTENPTDLLDYVIAHPKQNNLYILDVDLQHELNGITLAKQIRDHDFSGTFVFVTTHPEFAHYTFKYHIEAMDYIIKGNIDEISKQVHECIEIAYKRHQEVLDKKEYWKIKTSGGIQKVLTDDIIFFEAGHTSHKLILHTMRNRFEFRGSLKDIAESSSNFYHCHRAYVVNIKNVKRVARLSSSVGEAEMTNGTTVPVNKSSIVPLKKCIMVTE